MNVETNVESAETLADRQKVQDAYERVNAMWKTQGGPATLRYVHHLPHGRALPLGLDLAEVDRVIAQHRQLLPRRPSRLAEPVVQGRRPVSRARPQGAGDGHRQTAGQMLFTGAVCYHLAGYMHHDIGRLLPETRHSMLRAVEIYWEAAPLLPLAPIADRDSLRRHRAAAVPAAAAQCRAPALRDPDRRRELQHDQHARRVGLLPRPRHGDDRSRRPGQGEFRARTGRVLRVADYDRALGAVADWIEQDDRLDGKRIGIYGRATGALLAIHAAASDKRFKAVVAHPAAFNFADFFEQAFAHTLVSHRLEMCSFLGAKTIEEGTRLVRQELTLEHVADRVDFPILSVCSADDDTMPTSQSTLLQQRVKGPVEIVTFPGKGHGGPSRISLPLEADWMADRLRS